MRTNYNRQARRAAHCFGPPIPERRRGLALSLRRLALTAEGHNLAAVAASIADALVLSDDVIDLLPPAPQSRR